MFSSPSTPLVRIPGSEGTLLSLGICSGYSSRAMSDRNAAIRALIEHRFPDATPVTHRTAEPVARGIEALDAILPGQGLPHGLDASWWCDRRPESRVSHHRCPR